MEAARIKEARRRLHRAWIYGGLVWSIAFIGIAAFVVWIAGTDKASEISIVLTLAMILALGTWAIFYFGALVFHVVKRVWNREPIMEKE